jgi:iron complex transport system substrate-binding protein
MRWLIVILILVACKKTSQENNVLKKKSETTQNLSIEYAESFKVEIIEDGYIISLTKPWPGAEHTFRYLLYRNREALNKNYNFDESLQIPIKNIIVTSTTHIPSLDTLGVLEKLIGFPNTKYISTDKAVKLVENGYIRDVGQNESLNTELLVELNPDVVVTFAVKGQNKSTESIKNAGIPVLYNSDWVESQPLGKAEWIKFFGLLFDKAELSEHIFEGVKKEYEKAKSLAKEAKDRPSVISGALWKDTWYLPSGESWQSKLIADANAKYLYAETEGTGSLSLSFESVFEKAKSADFWIAPAQYTSYTDMNQQHSHYKKFAPFQNRKIFTFASTLGKNGGVLYYELAPNRPDLVLKDLISILHPELFHDYRPFFFKPLTP